MASLQLQQWSLTLSGYDYVIHYRSDNEQVQADAFSWLPCSQHPDNVSVSSVTYGTFSIHTNFIIASENVD